MEPDAIPPRIAVTVGLLAIVPALWYALGRPSTAGFISPSTAGFITVANVIIITAALYTAMSPTDHADSSATA